MSETNKIVRWSTSAGGPVTDDKLTPATLGIPREWTEAVDARWCEAVSPDDQAAAMQVLSAVAAGLEAVGRFECRVRSAGGWRRVATTVWREPGGGLAGIHEDRSAAFEQAQHQQDQLEAWRRLADSVPDAIMRVGIDLRVLEQNLAAQTARLVPVLEDGAVRGGPPGEGEDWLAHVKTVLAFGRADLFELTLPTLDGRGRHIEHRLLPEFDAAGQVVSVLAQARDVTWQRQAELQMAGERDVLADIADDRPLDAILDKICLQQEQLLPHARCSVMLLRGRQLFSAAAPSLPASYTSAINGIEVGPNVGSCGTAAFNGRTMVVEDIASHPAWAGYSEFALSYGLRACWSQPVFDRDRRVLGTFGVYYLQPCRPTEHDLDVINAFANLVSIAVQHADRRERLEQLATTDELTSCVNRRQFYRQVEQELARLKRLGGEAVLLMLDLDHFKQVNDRFGHAGGDAVLQHFADLCRNGLRDADVLARLGGEEFGVLLVGAGLAQGRISAERLRALLEAAPCQLADGRCIGVTVSIGVTSLRPDDPDVDTALRRADEGLYAAKRAGRNRVEG